MYGTLLVNVNSLQWRYNGRDGVSNHQPHDCLLNRLFRGRSKKTSKLRVTGFCDGNSPVTSEFPAQRASNAENVSIWWCHHVGMISIMYLNKLFKCKRIRNSFNILSIAIIATTFNNDVLDLNSPIFIISDVSFKFKRVQLTNRNENVLKYRGIL